MKKKPDWKYVQAALVLLAGAAGASVQRGAGESAGLQDKPSAGEIRA